MRHVIAVVLENEAGALSRVIGLFSQRNFNIESLTVATTQDPTLSRITMSTHGDGEQLEQITKQLNKLVSVFKVIDLSENATTDLSSDLQGKSFIEREILLVKVRAVGGNRAEFKRVADIFGATIVDTTAVSYIIQLTAKSKAIDAFLRALDAKLILEVVRSGSCGIARGEKSVSVKNAS